MALTEDGLLKARSFRKRPIEERFDPEVLKKVKGVPWEATGEFDMTRYGKPLVSGTMAASLPIIPAALPPLPEKKIVRRMYITGADIRRFGGTEGCLACRQ
eukprot:3858136-Amphidinium_carterae.1